MTKRLDWVDVLRGSAIILVVLGHTNISNGFLLYLIYSFHMPLFFAISGFLAGYSDSTCNNWIFKVKKILCSYGIPYVFFSIIYILFNVFAQRFITVSTIVSMNSISNFLYKPVAQYWFLYVLIIYSLIGTLFKSKYRCYLLGSMSIIFYIIGYTMFPAYMDGVYFKCFSYYFAFAIAELIGKHYNKWKEKQFKQNLPVKMFFVIIYIFLIICNYFIFSTYTNVVMSITKLLIMILGIVIWTYSITAVSNINNHISSVLVFIGNKSWYIFLLHSYFTSLVRNLAYKFTNLDIVVTLLALFAGIIFPIFVSILCEKISIFNFFFYPQRYLKIKSNH